MSSTSPSSLPITDQLLFPVHAAAPEPPSSASTTGEQESGSRPLLSSAVMQGEWDQTIARLQGVCELIDHTVRVEQQVGYINIRKTPTTNIEGIERVLFQNLTFAPWTRTEHADRITLGGEWLWRWRRAVPFKAEKVGHMSRLVPDAPQHQWTYRYNVIEVED